MFLSPRSILTVPEPMKVSFRDGGGGFGGGFPAAAKLSKRERHKIDTAFIFSLSTAMVHAVQCRHMCTLTLLTPYNTVPYVERD